MKKLIKNFLISTEDVAAASSVREFTINGDVGSVFDLQITNEDGHYYSFEKGVFSSSKIITTTSSTRGSIKDSYKFHILNPNSNLFVGMIVTGDGIPEQTKIISLENPGTGTTPSLITTDKPHTIPDSTTVTFTSETGLNEQQMTTGSFTGVVVLPAVTDDDHYDFLLTASHKDNTFLDYTDPEIDFNIASSTYGEFLTTGFRNDLFKSIRINQFTNTTATINLVSSVLTAADVNLSSFSFNISKSRGFVSDTGFKTSFEWTVVCPTNLAIRKSLDLVANYFKTNETHTVNGAVTNSRTVVLDSVDNLVVGMQITAVSSGSLAGNSYIQLIDKQNKTIIIGANNSFADGITLTFTARGALGPSSYGTNLSFQNLAVEIPDLTVTVNGATSNSTTLILDDANFIQSGTTTIIKGVGIDVDNTVTNISARSSGSNTITLSSAKTVEDGVTLTVEGSSSTAIITGDVVLTKMGSLDFTTSLDLSDFLGIGVS